MISPRVALVLVAMLAVGCGGVATSVPEPPPASGLSPVTAGPGSTAPPSAACTASAAKGRCGPYDTYRHITGTTASTYIGNNVWNPIPGQRQTLYANDPGDWSVTANLPAGNTAVVSYPSIGANYGQITDVPTPLADYSSFYSSFRENMHATPGTSAWAAYDLWLGKGGCSPAGSTCASYEVMIQHDFAGNGACGTLATASFGGSGGVPVQTWKLCKYGSEVIWKLTRDEQSGSVDILSMLRWLVNHRYLPSGTGLWEIGYGWEICSTGGVDENFQVSGFSTTPTLSKDASPSPSSS